MSRILIFLSVVLSLWTLTGCSGTQLSKIDSDLMRTQSMIRTDRSETHAETELLRSELNDLRTRVDHLAKIQADTLVSLDENKLMLQQMIQMMNDIKSGSSKTHTHAKAIPDSDGTAGKDETTQRPEAIYQTAYNDYINRKYDLSIVEFQDFLSSFPDSELADNALYWISECYYAQAKFEDAVNSFDQVITEYPKSEKSIAALLKKGLCYLEMGNNEKAQEILEDLINRFPFSEESRIAEDRLKSISSN
jgi:tol-pal system protein YbgF